MTTEQVDVAIASLNDPGTAVMIANALIASKDEEQINDFLVATIKKSAEGHHQAREISSAAILLMNGLKNG